MNQRPNNIRSDHEMRVKTARDDRSRMQYALEQGKLAMMEEWKLQGGIGALRELLRIEPTCLDELTLDQLAALKEELLNRYHERNN